MAAEGPGYRHVGAVGVTVWMAIYFLVTLALFYALYALDLAAEPVVEKVEVVAAQAAAVEPKACVLPLAVDCLELTRDRRLMLVVLIGGALGSLLHILRSFGWYVGNRGLRRSWLAYYAAMPFTGALLGLVFYVIVRAGFFSPGSSAESEGTFGFLAVAMLVGLFSQPAVLKLKEIADVVFTEPAPGNEAVPQKSATGVHQPAIEGIRVVLRADGAESDALWILGSGFAEGCDVTIDGEKRIAERHGDTELKVALTAADLAALEQKHEIVVTNPDGSISTHTGPFESEDD